MFSTRLSVFLFAALLVFGQAKTPVTTEQLIQMQKLGMAEQTIIDTIRTNGSGADTSPQGIIALKTAGLSDRIISAVQNGGSPTVAVAGSSAAETGAIPDEIGVYVAKDGGYVRLQSEIVNIKTKGIPVPGVVTLKVQGTVSGVKSPTQLNLPVEIMLRCQDDGTTATDYQLVLLVPQKDHREFTKARAGAYRSTSTGVDQIPMKFEKIGHSAYRAKLTELKRGEYGILAPSGKLYTFGIVE
jgi:hypothetical protein